MLCSELGQEEWEGALWATRMGLDFIPRAWKIHLQAGYGMSAAASVRDSRLAGKGRWGSEGWSRGPVGRTWVSEDAASEGGLLGTMLPLHVGCGLAHALSPGGGRGLWGLREA